MSRFDRIEQDEIRRLVKKHAPAGGGGGVTDHGLLTGLADDDHSQYHNNARGDARYPLLGHTHPTTDITGLNLDSLSDAVITTPIAAQVLSYNGTNWVNTAPTYPGGSGGGGGARIFYLWASAASDIAGYKQAQVTPSLNASNTITTSLSGTGDVLIVSFATEVGEPSTDLLPIGIAKRLLHGRLSVSNGTARYFVRLYQRTLFGVETLLRSGYSENFSNSSIAEIAWDAVYTSSFVLALTDRLVFKIYASRISGPASFDIITSFEGDEASYIVTTIPNKVYMEQLEDVLTTSLTKGDVLVYNSTTSLYGNSYRIPYTQTLLANTSLSSVTTAQSIFPSASDVFTIDAESTWLVEGTVFVQSGTVSHTTAIRLSWNGLGAANAGTSEFTSFTGATGSVSRAQDTTWFSTPNGGVIDAASTGAFRTIKFSAQFTALDAGNITPTVTFSVAPTGTNLIMKGSWIRFTRLGADTYDHNGGWA
jgi:hypothetical protein